MGPTVEEFLAACKANPDDDAPWSQFSDWLEERGHEWAPYFRRRRWTNSIGMEFALVPPGKFLMDSPPNEKGRGDGSQIEVVIERPFWLAMAPVTQEQWLRVFKKNPSYFKGDGRLPVESVSWDQSMKFCAKLSRAEDGPVYRLPEEWEWEYACRAGTTTRYWCGEALTADVARYASDGPAPVGERRANPWGFFDMHGNVWEWCATPWADQPQGPDFFCATASLSQGDGSYRVIRGGCWSGIGLLCRSAFRDWCVPAYRNFNLGFRVASTVEESHDRQ